MNMNENSENFEFIKYPRTKHISDFADKQGSLTSLVTANQKMVIEEKMDGTQVGISFLNNGDFQIQSRGTIISSEPEFSLLKNWLWQHIVELSEVLGERYILFGEWLYAKHTMYYNLLPDYFLEFDVYDRTEQCFLSTKKRQKLLGPLTFLHSVRVIEVLNFPTLSKLQQLIDKSTFISKDAYAQLKQEDLETTDTTGLMEGLYIKVENENSVLNRFKLVRPEFIQKIIDSGSHWKDRELVYNKVISL